MGYIDGFGQYHTGNIPLHEAVPRPTSVWKQSNHDDQRANHQADLVQPYLRNGEPNPAFIELYPDESKETFKFIPTDEELIKEG